MKNLETLISDIRDTTSDIKLKMRYVEFVNQQTNTYINQIKQKLDLVDKAIVELHALQTNGVTTQ